MARSLESDLDEQLRSIRRVQRKLKQIEGCEHERMLEVTVSKGPRYTVTIYRCATDGCPHSETKRRARAI